MCYEEKIQGFKSELEGIFKGDRKLLNYLDWVFLIPIVERTDDLEDEFIDGFCLALFASGKLESTLEAERVANIIKEARNSLYDDLNSGHN